MYPLRRPGRAFVVSHFFLVIFLPWWFWERERESWSQCPYDVYRTDSVRGVLCVYDVHEREDSVLLLLLAANRKTLSSDKSRRCMESVMG